VRILILGVGKSGTTALFYKIKNSLPSHAVCLFEPRAFGPALRRAQGRLSLSRWFSRREPVILAKILPFDERHPVDYDSFSSFDKQVMIVRDPRDQLISKLLYGVRDSDLWSRDGELEEFLQALAAKEADPRAVPLQRIVTRRVGGDLADWTARHRRSTILQPLRFHQEHDRLFVYRYESMVDRRFRDLEEYLGLPLVGPAEVDREVSRVVRTKSYGSWRDWFTPPDIDFFRPLLQPFLDRYYPDADWDLSPSPRILPEHASRYVERIVNERRALEGIPPLRR
jgi:hypothetical protein